MNKRSQTGVFKDRQEGTEIEQKRREQTKANTY